MCPPGSAIPKTGYWPERPGADASLGLLERGHRQARVTQLVPVVLGQLTVAGPDDRQAAEVDAVGDREAAVDVDPGDQARQRRRDVLEGVVVVVADDHPPGAAEGAVGS